MTAVLTAIFERVTLEGFCWGTLTGVVLTIVVLGLNRDHFRSVALSDAADFLRHAAARKRWAGCQVAPRVLEAYAAALDDWAEKPQGGRENMPPVPDVPEIGFLRDGTGGR